MLTPRQVQSIATVNTCVNNRIYAFFQHKGCGCKCKGDCVHKQMFYFLIMDALNSPYIDELTQTQINCMISHADCGNKFPPPPTPGACLSCDYSIDFSLAAQLCDYTFTFNLKTSEIVSYTKNGITTTVNEIVSADMPTLLAYLQTLDATFTGFTVSGSTAIFNLDDTPDQYAFTTTVGGIGAPDVVGVPTVCTSAFPFWIYTFNGITVNEQFNDYTELQDYLLTLGFSPTIPGIITSCVYTYSFTAPFGGVFGYDIVITINGVPQTAIPIANQTDLDNFFIGYGFTKISDTYYTHPTTSDVYGDVTFSLTGSLVCTSPPQSLIPLEVSIYLDTTILPALPFTGISLDLDGTVYTDGATYTTVQQMLEWMNSLVTGQGYFYYDTGANQIVARVASYSAPLFGDIIIDTAGTPVTVVVSTSATTFTCWKFTGAGIVYPTTTESISIDGTTFGSSSNLANVAALVAWINGLGTLTLGYASASGADIYLQHKKSTMSASVTFPTTLFEIYDGTTIYTAPGAINDAYEAVQYMNTIGIGEFSTNGTIIYFMPHDFHYNWVYTTDDGGTWYSSTSGYTGALQPVLNLYVCAGVAGGDVTISPYVSNCVSDYIFSILDTCDYYNGTTSIGTVDITTIFGANDSYTVYDLTGVAFPNAFEITIDAVTSAVIYATSIGNLNTQLNALATGVFVVDGTTIVVNNDYTFGDLEWRNVTYLNTSTAKLPGYVTIGINATNHLVGAGLTAATLQTPLTALGLGTSLVVDNGATMDVTMYGFETYGNIGLGSYSWDVTTFFAPSIGANVLIDGVLVSLGAPATEAALAAAMSALSSVGFFDYDSTTHGITLTSSRVFGRIQSSHGTPPIVATQTFNLKTAPELIATPTENTDTIAPQSFAPTTIAFTQSNCHDKFPVT